MMYKFIELPDKTEITHSDMRDDGTVKVCVEKPVEGDFKTAYCELPSYRWYDVEGYTKEELEEQQRIVESLAHLTYTRQLKLAELREARINIRQDRV